MTTFSKPVLVTAVSIALLHSSQAVEPNAHQNVSAIDSVLNPSLDATSICDCASHLSEGIEKLVGTGLLNLPEGMPQEFQIDLSIEGEEMTLHFEKNRVFGANTRFLVDDGAGSLKEIELGEDGSYLGWIIGKPSFKISAFLNKNGLYASILRPGEGDVRIQPGDWSNADRLHDIVVVQPDASQNVRSSQVARFETTRQEIAGNKKTALKDPFVPLTASRTKSVGGSTATLAPSRVMDVREYEVGVEIGSRAFISDTYNSNLSTAQASAASVVGNLDRRYLSSAGIKHRLGTVIIRTNASTDPLRDSVTATGAAANASSSLSAFRNYWNSNAGEVGNTHDLAVYHVKSAPSGLAYVNSVGGGNRYATCGGNGTTSWADGTLAHEFGHSWSLGHYNASKGNFYESKPRNNSGSNSAGGSDVFVCVMHGGGSHNIGRLSTGEANQVYNVRQTKLSYGDVVSNPGNITPFGHRDDASSQGTPIRIDVIANDYDSNNDVLDVRVLDTKSQQGGTISLSSGTGPGGRNEILYSPPSGHNGTDFFHYTVCDPGGKTDWGAVYVTNSGPLVVDLSAEQYNYDFGAPTSPVMNGWSGVTPDTIGDVSWSGSLGSVDRGASNGVNDINRDFVSTSQTRTFNHKISNGIWAVTINMGDLSQARELMRVSAENGQVVKTNVNSNAAQFVYVTFDVEVSDGELNITFSDDGGSSPEWALTRMSLSLIESTVDVDNDGLLDNWENQYFGNITSTSGLPNEDDDGDGLTDREEYSEGTDPTKEDSDDDRLSDVDELNIYFTNPSRADSDGDLFNDGIELLYTTDPNNGSSTPVVPELVGYYPFDEGSGSTGGNFGSAGSSANAQQNQGTIGWTSSDQRIGGASLNLAGNSSLNAPSVIPSSATEFTISVWVNPGTDGGYKGIYAGRDSPGNWGVNVENGHADVRFANTGNSSFGIDTVDNSVVAAGGWYHIAQTWVSDGSQTTSTVYLNGSVVGSSTSARPDFSQPTNGFFIGDDPCCGGREFNGQIDDLAIFTRVLSGSEIFEVYSEGQKGIGAINAIVPPTNYISGIQNFTMDGANAVFDYQTRQNVNYKIYSSTDMVNWNLMETVAGDGAFHQFKHTGIAVFASRFFYRLEEE